MAIEQAHTRVLRSLAACAFLAAVSPAPALAESEAAVGCSGEAYAVSASASLYDSSFMLGLRQSFGWHAAELPGGDLWFQYVMRLVSPPPGLCLGGEGLLDINLGKVVGQRVAIGAGLTGFVIGEYGEANGSALYRIGCYAEARYEPLVFLLPGKLDSRTAISILGLSASAYLHPHSELRFWLLGLTLIGVDTRYGDYSSAPSPESVAAAVDEPAIEETPAPAPEPREAKGVSFRYLAEVGAPCLMYYVPLPIPFAEWSFGGEIRAGWYTGGISARLNLMGAVLWGATQVVQVEASLVRLRIGAWRPALVGGAYARIPNGGSDPSYPPLAAYGAVELLTFDFAARGRSQWRITVLPVSSAFFADPLYSPSLVRLGVLF